MNLWISKKPLAIGYRCPCSQNFVEIGCLISVLWSKFPPSNPFFFHSHCPAPNLQALSPVTSMGILFYAFYYYRLGSFFLFLFFFCIFFLPLFFSFQMNNPEFWNPQSHSFLTCDCCLPVEWNNKAKPIPLSWIKRYSWLIFHSYFPL